MPKQFLSGFLVAVLLTASGLLWAVMFFGPLANLSRLSGGMTPFDIRSWGYSYAEARAFLEAIGAEGRAYYKVRNFRRQTYSCARTKISAHHNPRAIRSGAPVEAGIPMSYRLFVCKVSVLHRKSFA